MRDAPLTLLSLLALLSSSGCGPSLPDVPVRVEQARRATGYPTRFARRSREGRAARERSFREDNPEPWSEIYVDPYGFVKAAVLSEPLSVEDASTSSAPRPFAPEELERWRAFLIRNGTYFGIDDPDALTWSVDERGIHVIREWEGQSIGGLTVRRGRSDDDPENGWLAIHGHLWPGVAAPPTDRLGDDQLVAPFLGQRAEIVLSCEPHPCDPAGEEYDCPDAPDAVTAPHSIAREDLEARRFPRVVYTDGGHGAAEIRLVAEVRLGSRPCPDRAPAGCDYVPESCPIELPDATTEPAWHVDAVTGERIEDPWVGPADDAPADADGE